MAARQVQILHNCLSAAVEPWNLRQLGWGQFRDYDNSGSDDPVEVCQEAFAAICIDDDGAWNGIQGVLTGFVTYLHGQTGCIPTQDQLANLKKLLDSRPVDQQAVRDWFDATYPAPKEWLDK